MANPAEKREIVEITTSNRFVCGKSVCLEPSNWLRDATALLHGLTGPPERTTDRTNPLLSGDRFDHLEKLISAVESSLVQIKLSQIDVGQSNNQAHNPPRA